MEWLKSSDGPAVIVSNAVALMWTDAEDYELPLGFKGGKNKKMGEFFSTAGQRAISRISAPMNSIDPGEAAQDAH
jgi:hypothetical protein